jgi:aminopeptidase N
MGKLTIPILLLTASNAFADNPDPELAKFANMPTVHQVTAEERKEIYRACDTFELNLDFYRRHPERNNDPVAIQDIRDNQDKLSKCQRRAAINVERLRTRGTAAEQYFRKAQEERQQAAELEAAGEQRKQQLLAVPKNARTIYGAIFCIDKKVRADAIAEIAKEKKYAKLAGMIDKVKLYKLQQTVRSADEHEATNRREFAEYKGLSPAPCTDATVKKLIACSQSDGGCESNEIKELAAMVSSPDDAQ